MKCPHCDHVNKEDACRCANCDEVLPTAKGQGDPGPALRNSTTEKSKLPVPS